MGKSSLYLVADVIEGLIVLKTVLIMVVYMIFDGGFRTLVFICGDVPRSDHTKLQYLRLDDNAKDPITLKF